MSRELDAIKKYIGTEAVTTQHYIDAGSIKFYAESILDPDPRYREISDEMLAPPCYYGSATGVRNAAADDPRILAGISVPMPAGWVGMNAADDFEMLEDMHPGDLLTCHEKITDAYEKQGKSGRLIFVLREKKYINQRGKVALIRRMTTVSRPASKEVVKHE
ncbi:MAG: MaoC family dehydratase N-terminal domain-containing protein [Dehalococcoidales bacterium]|nr:MaoC family dehydratase N-terminal domain-containing protein [Dehalococcoidales bacterium]